MANLDCAGPHCLRPNQDFVIRFSFRFQPDRAEQHCSFYFHFLFDFLFWFQPDRAEPHCLRPNQEEEKLWKVFLRRESCRDIKGGRPSRIAIHIFYFDFLKILLQIFPETRILLGYKGGRCTHNLWPIFYLIFFVLN